MSSSLAFVREYKPAKEVFYCGGTCQGGSGFSDDYCSLCRWMLRTLSKMGIGTYYDSAIDHTYRGNLNAQRWKDELAQEVSNSTSDLAFVLDSAMQARGIRTIYKVVEIELPIGVVRLGLDGARAGSLKTKAMIMMVNAHTGQIHPRLHVVPINAAYMLREMIMLPKAATEAEAFAVVERYTLPIETAPL